MPNVSGNCKMHTKQIHIFLSLLLVAASCKQTNEELIDKAYDLSKQKKYDQAIKVYSEVIKKNEKLQLPYYNRGLCYVNKKEYLKALADFNKVIDLHMIGGFIWESNPDSPIADEETKQQVPYNDAVYQKAQVMYYIDSTQSSFNDFQVLASQGYEKSNCLLWLGTIMIRNKNNDKACQYFLKAKEFALTDDDKNEADKIFNTYCAMKNNNR